MSKRPGGYTRTGNDGWTTTLLCFFAYGISTRIGTHTANRYESFRLRSAFVELQQQILDRHRKERGLLHSKNVLIFCDLFLTFSVKNFVKLSASLAILLLKYGFLLLLQQLRKGDNSALRARKYHNKVACIRSFY